MRNKRHTQIVEYYNAMALYAISNRQQIKKMLPDLLNEGKPEKKLDGKQTAEKVAEKIGVKINWGEGEVN